MAEKVALSNKSNAIKSNSVMQKVPTIQHKNMSIVQSSTLSMVQLQKMYGNRALCSLLQNKKGPLSRVTIQTLLQPTAKSIQELEDEKKNLNLTQKIQKKENQTPLLSASLNPKTIAGILESQQGQGFPLQASIQSKALRVIPGINLSQVKIHTDATAIKLNETFQSRAFTNGFDIYFNKGEYNPTTTRGQNLLGHELAHVKQQNTIPDLQYRLDKGGQRDHYEIQADIVGKQFSSQVPINHISKSSALISATKPSIQLSSKSFAKTPILQFGLLDRIKKGAGSIVEGVKDAAQGIANTVSAGIDWVIEQIKPLVTQIPGYDLLSVIIGREPLTGKAVERNAINLLSGLAGCIPGGKAIFENLNKAGAITRAFDWVSKEINTLGLTFESVYNVVQSVLKSLSPGDLLNPLNAVNRVKAIITPIVQKIFTFAKAAGSKLMEFVFEGALSLVGAPVEKIMAILNKGKEVIGKIINDPITFIKHLFSAVVGGIQGFSSNILKHLQSGITGWLFGTLTKAGISLPEKFDLPGVFSLVAQILGVTWQNIRQKIVTALGPQGEKIMGFIETSVDIVKDFLDRGPIALWDHIKNYLSNLKDMVLGAIIDWVKGTIVVKAIEKLVSFFNPAGAIIQAVIAIYNTVQFFIERIKQIMDFAESVFNSIAEIASGNIAKAAKAVEDAMAKSLPVMISFLARLIGLGGIADKIKETIDKIRKPIDSALTKVIGFIVDKAKPLINTVNNAINKVQEKVESVLEWWKHKESFALPNGEEHELYFQGKNESIHLVMASETPTDPPKWIEDNVPKDKQKDLLDLYYQIQQYIKDHLDEIPDIKARYSTKKKRKEARDDRKQLYILIDKFVALLKKSGAISKPINDPGKIKEVHDLIFNTFDYEGQRLLKGHGDYTPGRAEHNFYAHEIRLVDDIGNHTGDHSFPEIKKPGQDHWTPDHQPPASIYTSGMSGDMRFYPHSQLSYRKQAGRVNRYIHLMKQYLGREKKDKWASGIKSEWFWENSGSKIMKERPKK